MTEIIIATISTGLPTVATIIAALLQYRTSSRNAARQAILQMILEDQFNWYAFGRFPINYQSIIAEYETYHKNGGNGVITEKVDDYKKWFASLEPHRDRAIIEQ